MSIYRNHTELAPSPIGWASKQLYRHLFLPRDLCSRESIVCIVSAILLADENPADTTDRLLTRDTSDAFSHSIQPKPINFEEQQLLFTWKKSSSFVDFSRYGQTHYINANEFDSILFMKIEHSNFAFSILYRHFHTFNQFFFSPTLIRSRVSQLKCNLSKGNSNEKNKNKIKFARLGHTKFI